MRPRISITLSPAERRRLEALVRDRNTAQKHVWRAEIVWLSAEGVIPQNLDSTFRAQPILGTSVRVHIAAVYLSACLARMKYLVEQTKNPRISAGI